MMKFRRAPLSQFSQRSKFANFKREKLQSLEISHFKINPFQISSDKSLSSNSFSESLSSEFLNKYEELEVLGRGQQSIVKKVQNKQTNQIFAAKYYFVEEQESIFQIRKEFEILSQLNHCNVIKSYEIFEDVELHSAIIILEYFNGISLKKFICNVEQTQNNQTFEIVYQILQAYNEIHTKNIVHRDVHLTNILYSPSQNLIKIIDFGLSRQINYADDICFTPVGKFKRRSPEMLKSTVYNSKSDIWQIGQIIYEIIIKKQVESQYVMQLMFLNENFIIDKQLLDQAKIPSNLLKGLLTLDKQQRSTCKEALTLLQTQ